MKNIQALRQTLAPNREQSMVLTARASGSRQLAIAIRIIPSIEGKAASTASGTVMFPLCVRMAVMALLFRDSFLFFHPP